MTMFKNLKFKYKISVITILAIVTFIVILIMTLSFTGKNERLLSEMVNQHTPAWELNHDLLNHLEWIQLRFQDAVSFQDEDEISEANKLRDTFIEKLNVAIGNPDLKENDLGNLLSLFSAYFNASMNASQLMMAGDEDPQVAAAVEQMHTHYNNLKGKLESNIVNKRGETAAGFNRTRSNNRVMLLMYLIVIIVSILLLVLVSLFINQSISGPLTVAINMAKKVADGNLSVEITDSSRKDEAGLLIKTIQKMVENLQALMGQIREGANALAAAAGQISTSVTQIASAATETASAATETSTTVEEVRQTALDSNKKAKNVSESAQKAVDVSQAGEQSVADTIEGMHRIEAQMSSIAESIMRLSEHGQAIGGIIAIVEDVAEQSRLLAVNASIEAVKAGEQGKGFAVVAQEVSILADKSKQATSRVRKILDDIQKATSEAVMKTEQGSKAVDAGVKQSAEAGAAIQRLADSVSESSQATTQIAVSSQEQLVGMDQVVSAMESIKQASNQNVSATKQVESAAYDLHTLGQKLKEVLERYSA
jgi:methyl-accepting chemotaxis protein